MATEAVNIDDVTRGCEPLQRDSINTIVFLKVVFEVVFISEIDEKINEAWKEDVRSKTTTKANSKSIKSEL